MAIKLHDLKDMERADWLEARKKGIGGSDAGAVMGMNSWSDPLTVYADKMGMIPDKETTEAMRVGTDLEQYVADRFCEATGKKVRRSNFMWQSEQHPFMLADIDREVVGENAALECKTVNAFTKYDLENGQIPAQYYCQVQHYISVMGYDYMYIAFLVMGVGFYWHKIERNNEFIENMIQQESTFWNEHIVKQIPPEADGSESSIATLNRMYPVSNNNLSVDLSLTPEIDEYEELKAIKKRAEDQMDVIKAKIIQEMEDAGVGNTGKYTVTYKSQSKTTVDSKRLKAEMPEIFEKYSNVSSTRVLRIKENKEK